ncbi:uncharacterized protein KGF55_000310 [Candida pseudojiufengensis]|uniref:uncharacterized protein n=1 Tax=Candida pseudojiufengensis TaxID=497109 RepID=UPI0022249271|nr:uncharacterized protein KGF55_000310 [Candida pseudojiufengensis]KAI5966901.1 hypothetical protein KGF55_000310 [Candida pseudojiufengensis]
MQDQIISLRLDSAETVTKFLRSKDEDIENIIQLIHDLLNQKLDLYFPNYKTFILNLLVDRLNERSPSSQFHNWKFNYKIWKILLESWDSFGASSMSRNECIKNLDIVENLIQVMAKNDKDSLKCIPLMFETLFRMNQSVFIKIDELLGLSLLRSFLIYLGKTTNVKADWANIIKQLYYRSCMIETQDMSKKVYSNFMESLFNLMIDVLSSPYPSVPTSVKDVLLDIFTRVVFAEGHIQYLKSSLEKILKSHEINDSSFLYFYQIVIEHLSSKNIKLCEELYILITQKLPSLSESMLYMLAESKKAISQEFMTALYNKEIKNKRYIDLNWPMVKYIFTIDNELAGKKSNFIFEKHNTDFEINSEVLPVGEAILKAYIKNRELVEFITKVWPKAIKKDELWDSQDFVIAVSKGISTLSERQILQVIQTSIELEIDAARAIFIAVTIGLVFASSKTVESLQNTFLKHKQYLDSKEEFWQVHYNLLILYGPNFSLHKDQLKLDYDLYYYFTVFRLLELDIPITFDEYDQSKFIKYLSENDYFISIVFKRWFIVFNNFFSKSNQFKIVEMAIYWNKTYGRLFSSINEQFYEQRKLTTILLDILIQKPELSYSCIMHIPFSCYRKGIRKELIDSITMYFIETQDLKCLQSLSWILSVPTYQSKIEKDFATMTDVLNKSKSGDWKYLSFVIATSIWKSQVQKVEDKTNQLYIENTITELTKYLKSSHTTEIEPKIELCLVILSSFVPTSNGHLFAKEFNAHCILSIKLAIKNQNLLAVSWYLWALASVEDRYVIDFKDTQEVISILDSNLMENEQTRRALFEIICKSAPRSIFAGKYIMSVFVLITSFEKEHLIFHFNNLVKYIAKFASEDMLSFKEISKFLIQSASDLDEGKSYVGSICLLISAILRNVSKESDPFVTTKLFAILLKYSSCIKNEVVSDEVLITIKKLLVENQFIFNQHILEMTIALIQKLSSTSSKSSTYINSTRVLSTILLHHRYKLTARHHLIINSISSMLELLVSSSSLGKDIASAQAFSRLMTNLCEPQERINDALDSTNNTLTTSANFFKKSLRNHLPVLTINYIYLNLKYSFHKEINDILTSGIFLIFDLLSKHELAMINSSLDYAGKALFKTMYHNYNEYWKWKDQ